MWEVYDVFFVFANVLVMEHRNPLLTLYNVCAMDFFIGVMPWVWQGGIHKSRPIFWEIGAQFDWQMQAGGMIEPQYQRMRSAFMNVPKPDPWHSLSKLKPTCQSQKNDNPHSCF